MSFLVMLPVVVLLYWCLMREIEVRFVVPDRFRGVIVVKESKTGKSPERVFRVGVVDVFEYHVNEKGVVLAKDISPMTKWHRQTARYRNGKLIQALGIPSPNDEWTMLRPLEGFGGTQTETEAYWLVGTRSEADRFHRDRQVWFKFED